MGSGPVSEEPEESPAWRTAYWFGWAVLWFFFAVFMLMGIFGCLLYNWRG